MQTGSGAIFSRIGKRGGRVGKIGSGFGAAGFACLLASPVRGQQVATFDDLMNLPPENSFSDFATANGGSVLDGVTWDAQFYVVGDQYGSDYACPHSGHFAVFNDFGHSGLTLTTTSVLNGAWFGQNTYAGGGHGAPSVTVNAMSGDAVLDSVSLDLTSTTLAYLDTSRFANLAGVTGYRIDNTFAAGGYGHWIADDFSWSKPAPTPGPPALLVALLGLAPLSRLRHKQRARQKV